MKKKTEKTEALKVGDKAMFNKNEYDIVDIWGASGIAVIEDAEHRYTVAIDKLKKL